MKSGNSWRILPRRVAITWSTGCSIVPEFYDFWALKFADVLRSNGRLIQTKGAYVFTADFANAWNVTCQWTSWFVSPDIRRIDVHKQVGDQLLPNQSRSRNGRRDHGPALSRGTYSVCQMPGNHPSSVGRRTIITDSPRSSPRSVARKATYPEEEVVFANGSGDVS